LNPFPNDLIEKFDSNPEKNLKITYKIGNIVDKSSLESLFSDNKVNVVIHAASLIAPWQDPKKHLAVNVGGTENILEISRKYGVRRFILISTLDVVVNENGIQSKEGSEDLPYATKPLYKAYAQSKIQQEKLVLSAYKPNEFFTCSLRPLGIFGPRDIYHVGSVLGASKSGKLFAWPSHAPAQWQHVFSGNVAYSAYCVVKKSREQEKNWILLGGKPFNVGDNSKVVDFIDFMEPYIVGMGLKMPGFRIPFFLIWIYAVFIEIIAYLLLKLGIRMPLNFTRLALHALVTKHVYSWERIRKFADYEPLFTHEESVSLTLDWFRANGIQDRFLDQ